jgi:large repetitive protein
VSGSTNATIVVASVNDIPVATAVSASAAEDAVSVSISLAGSDTDGTVVKANITNLPTAAQGFLYLADGITPVTLTTDLTPAQMAGLVFKPTPNYFGTVAIAYTVTDNESGVSVAKDATITITPVNDAPIATAVAVSGNEDAASIAINLVGTDIDGTIANGKIGTLPPPAQGVLYMANGTTAVTTAMVLSPTELATLVFKPAANFSGAVSIAYTVTDNLGLASSSSNATITVIAINDAPTWSSAAPVINVNEQSTTTLNGRGLLISDVDASTGLMTLTISSGTSTDALTVAAGTSGVTVLSGNGTSAVVLQGTLAQLDALLASTGAAGTITHAQTAFTPTANEGATSATITLLVNDQGNAGSGGALDASKTVTINITGVASTVVGTLNSSDVLYGGAASDIIYGGGGMDSLYGGAGDDVLVGGSGFARNGSFEMWHGTSTANNTTGATLVFGGSAGGIDGWTFEQYTGTTKGAGVGYGQLSWKGTNGQYSDIANTAGSGHYALDHISGGSTVNTASQSIQTIVGETYTVKVVYSGTSATNATPIELGAGTNQSAALDLYWDNVLVTGATSTYLNQSSANTVATGTSTNYFYERTWTVSGTGAVANLRLQDTTVGTPDAPGIYLDNVRVYSGTGNGNDSLDGGSGVDRLYGGGGNDTLTGGAGADRFVFSMRGADNSAGHDGDDTITDFVVGTDVIVLTDLIDVTAFTYPGAATTATSSANATLNLADLVDNGVNKQLVTLTDTATETLLTFSNGATIHLTGVHGQTLASLSAAGSLLLTLDSFHNVV